MVSDNTSQLAPYTQPEVFWSNSMARLPDPRSIAWARIGAALLGVGTVPAGGGAERVHICDAPVEVGGGHLAQYTGRYHATISGGVGVPDR